MTSSRSRPTLWSRSGATTCSITRRFQTSKKRSSPPEEMNSTMTAGSSVGFREILEGVGIE
jgi:hypothetical protein